MEPKNNKWEIKWTRFGFTYRLTWWLSDRAVRRLMWPMR